jgi:hypothetical protein
MASENSLTGLPFGIVNLAPALEMNESYDLVCVGISGYWAGEGGSPRLEDSPPFTDFRQAVEWAKKRGSIIYIRASIHGPLYSAGDREEKGVTSIPFQIDEAESEYQSDFGRVVG